MSYIQFSHANGFPAKTYTTLFNYLNGYDISSIEVLASSKNPNNIIWDELTEEIIDCVQKIGEPVVGIGHSFGGLLTLLAASKKPEYFRSVILLDPPIFSPLKRQIISILRKIKMDDKFSPAGKSKKRREYFDSMQHALEYFKTKELFSNFHPKVFNDYLEHGLVEVENGLKLLIPVENEVAIFRSFQINYPSKIFNVNGILVYGTKNSIYWKSDIKWINCNFKKIKLIPFPGSHLFPLENPESSAKLIKRYI